MIRVGFYTDMSSNWIGGLNYLKNLFLAMKKYDSKHIQMVLFCPSGAETKLVEELFIDTEIIYTDFGYQQLEKLVEKYNIDVFSHKLLTEKNLKFKVLNWIPDFQHMYLREMFTNQELCDRDRDFKNAIFSTDLLVLSSQNALNDLKKFAPESVAKARVLNFVSVVDFHQLEKIKQSDITKKYGYKKYFYLPNQFWKHKNHLVVLQAVAHLKENNIDIILLCSGKENDYRDQEYFFKIKQYIHDSNLQENVYFLGLIPYEDVQVLIRYSVSVINPSLFEGWSTTVEECKSIGKSMILSNIEVHKEQNPEASFYFNPNNFQELANIMKNVWLTKDGGIDIDLELKARKNIDDRLKAYAKTYEAIVLEVFKLKKVIKNNYNLEQNLEFAKVYNNFYSCVNQLKSNKERYIIYGFGTIGKTIQALIPEKIVAFVDQNSNLTSKKIIKDEVYHPNNLQNMEYDKIIISVLGRENEIEHYLIEKQSVKKEKIMRLTL